MKGRLLEYVLSQPLMVEMSAAEAATRILRDREGGPRAVEARRGREIEGAESGMVRRGPTAVLSIVGPISRYADLFTHLCGGATVESLALDLQTALDDPEVRSIVLEIDSPGGEANGIGELAAQIRAASARKEVVARVGNQAASAAYYLAAAAGRIVISDAALLGSIGVIMGLTTQADRPGQKTHQFISSQSPHKRPDPETDAGRAQIQRLVDGLAAVFVADVARYRATTPERVQSEFGAGGLRIGRDAVAAGMADSIGSLEGLLAELAARPAQGPDARVSASEAEENPMRLWKKKNGALAVQAAAVDEGDAPLGDDVIAQLGLQPADGPPKPSAGPDRAQAPADDRVTRLEEQLREANSRTLAAEAAGRYTALLHAGRIVPAEQSAFVKLYIRAGLDDLDRPVAAGETSRAALVDAVFAARSPHTLGAEQLDPAGKPEGDTDAPAGDADAQLTEAQISKLMQLAGLEVPAS